MASQRNGMPANDSPPPSPRVKAVVFDRYGAAEVLRAIDLPMPQAGPGEIRVRVRAAGVRPSDIALRSGLSAGAHGGARARFPHRLGNEFAGVVDQIGAGVADFAVGDEVMGWAAAMSYAEALTVPATQAVHKPHTMTWAVAGALPSTGQTAHAALRQLGVGAGQTVLIHGAAGALGCVAVQLAVAWGARVIGTAAAADHDYLRSLGAQPVSDDHAGVEQVRALAPHGVDALFDACGQDDFAPWLALAAPQRALSLSRRYGLAELRSARSRERLAELVAMHERHGLLVPVREMFPLTRAAEAHRAVERGPARGKVVLMVYEAMPLALLRLSA
ncbi:NADP-dependent oxidoreductase [Lysobacter enzymogenes]|uniref:Alcohol dehydrogenase zinc-binding domain-containing protein n=1 Tax=Lysobacter enzymogenes TaxID=69 RepID=A0AAU9AQV1_LYSEN|nr:NADP-dependent oxidoreductase [Lysobacter enzymogenes]BAV98423.1 alcohol dehydrogenase zinc-binding domain-containing protein [Lysobacter enzymogenes]